MPKALTHYCQSCDWQQTQPFFGDSSLSHCPRCRSERLDQRQATRLEAVATRLANQRPPPYRHAAAPMAEQLDDKNPTCNPRLNRQRQALKTLAKEAWQKATSRAKVASVPTPKNWTILLHPTR
jgi:hypothetical protein